MNAAAATISIPPPAGVLLLLLLLCEYVFIWKVDNHKTLAVNLYLEHTPPLTAAVCYI